MTSTRLLSALYACFLLPMASNAAVIGPDDFGGSERIVTYDNLPQLPNNSPIFTPVIIEGDTYYAGPISGTFRYTDTGCVSGNCIRTNDGSQDANIYLGQVANRVGIYIRESGSHILTVWDSNGTLLGSDRTGTEIPGIGWFYGYESLGAPIARVRFDMRNGGICCTNHFDNFTTEAVPIPQTLWLFGSGLLGLIGISRRKNAA